MTMGQGDCVDWPIIWPVSVIQTMASSLPVPCLDVGKCLLFCTKASVDYCHTQTKTWTILSGRLNVFCLLGTDTAHGAH